MSSFCNFVVEKQFTNDGEDVQRGSEDHQSNDIERQRREVDLSKKVDPDEDESKFPRLIGDGQGAPAVSEGGDRISGFRFDFVGW